MYSTSKWAVEPVQVPELVEFPRLLLWKRTALLGVVGISIGLGGGYLLGRSVDAKTEPANSPQRPALRVRFIPIPDYDPGELTKSNEDGEAVQTWMPPAADSPGAFAEDLPPRRKARPALIRLENASPRNSDRG
jgi:hypothetical protein